MEEQKLEVELNQLLAVGKVVLPHLAWTYATLNNHVADSARYDNAAFAACPATAGWAQDRLRGSWTALRDELQDILGRSAKSIEDAGDAIMKVAANYEATNADVAAQVKKAWKEKAPSEVVSNLSDRQLPPPPPRIIFTNE